MNLIACAIPGHPVETIGLIASIAGTFGATWLMFRDSICRICGFQGKHIHDEAHDSHSHSETER